MKDQVDRVIELLRSGELAARYGRLVTVQEHPARELVILNYTHECQYSRHWDEVTRWCRGLIVDTTRWRAAAWPFAKFFNVNEVPETCVEALPREPFAVFEKLDGSLGLLFRGPDGPALASRGSFTSEQARRGTAMLRALPGLGTVPEPLTLLFEIIYPENKSVLRYDFAGLVLLAGFDRVSGEELPWAEVGAIAARLGCRTPRVFPFATLAEVLESRERLPADLEGFVLRFESGLRVKLKGDAYLTLHRLVSNLSEKRVLGTLADGTFESFLREVPEEFRGEVEALADRYHHAAAALRDEAERLFALAPRDGDRKTFAQWVTANVPAHLRAPLFQRFDGRESYNWYRLIHLRDPDAPAPGG